MPELPEVETVVRDLRPLAVGRTVRAVRAGAKALRKPWRAEWAERLVGRRVEGIRRRGKWIVVDLSDGPRLVVHLGMTGQFTAVSAAAAPPDHLHLVLELDDGTELRFRDPRRFGSVTLHDDEAAVAALFADLGPEPFDIDAKYFRTAVRGTTRTLKVLLLDQTVVAGVGNIYADEACSRAGLHPGRRGESLTPTDADRLRAAIGAVLTAAVAGRGSTIRDYVGGSGLRGGFQHEHRVYGRTGQPCGACATAIECVRIAGRSSHFCPRCQKSSPRSTQRPRRKPEARVENPRL